MSSIKKVIRRKLTISLFCCLVVAIPAAAAPSASAMQSAAQEYFSDVVLNNQHGEEVRLYSDVLKGNVVVINIFSATCNDICVVINRKLAGLQERLGDRLGREVFLISITSDPIIDTPARLKAHAAKLNARPGWIFLTGQKENVDIALSKFGGNDDDKETHSKVVFIGNEATGLWKKVNGLAETEDMIKVVESVLNDVL